MNDNTEEDEAVQSIDKIITDIEAVIVGKEVNHVVSAFAYILAENADCDDEAVAYSTEMTLRILKGYGLIKAARKMQ